MMSPEEINAIVSYDPETGLLSRKDGRPVSLRPSPEGYLRIWIGGRSYLQHRVAWAIAHGAWPRIRIDHINGSRVDNRICNLRECDISQNLMNSGAHVDNSHALKGVSKNKSRFSASICAYKKRYHLGTFDRPEEAHEAYCEAALRIHGEFAMTSSQAARVR